jgi:SAM-dependent methyltransferase
MKTTVLSPSSKFVYTLMQSLGQTSDSIRLGFNRGFDSVEMMDRIYQNEPSGLFGIGQVLDWIYLNQSGCRGLRGRKLLLKQIVRQTIARQRSAGLQPFIVDVASGPANYLVEALAEDGGADVHALARDLDRGDLRRGEALAGSHRLANIQYMHAGALDEEGLCALTPRPTVLIASGLYEILGDNSLIRRSMQIIRRCLAPDGTFIFTTQVNHPQLELIRALPGRNGGSWVVKNRPVQLMEHWARSAGFRPIRTQLEPDGLFGVTVCK